MLKFLRIVATVLVVLACGSSATTRVDAAAGWLSKLDPLLQGQRSLTGRSRVILRVANAGAISPVLSLVQLTGGHLIRSLPIIDAVAVDLPNASLALVAGNSLVLHVSMDRVVVGAMERTGATIGATAVRQELGYDGSGVGVAVIDSGVAPAHDDLADPARRPARRCVSSIW